MNKEIPINLPSRVKLPREQQGGGKLVPLFTPRLSPRQEPRASRWLGVGGCGRATGRGRALTASPAARCCLAPSCPEAERTRAWWPGHWARVPVRGSGSAGWSASSCWGSWRTSGDGTECGCEGEAEGASESTGCGGLEDLEREEGETAVSGCRPQRRRPANPRLYLVNFWRSRAGHIDKTANA